jgi:hypothetical protein
MQVAGSVPHSMAVGMRQRIPACAGLAMKTIALLALASVCETDSVE